MTVAILDDEKRVSASITAGADMYTTILAYVIAFLGLVMIGSGVWGLFYLQSGARPIPLSDLCWLWLGWHRPGFARVGRDRAHDTAALNL